eukprot:XP_784540.2 PREDICTED: apoptotic chromatin condensation inducer in the nucleus isoform X2 [Strongylocentrotus purpuratus]
MAESKESVTLPDGRPIESLRVVDLKQQLKKYGVSVNGSKIQLVDRLKGQIYLEELKQAPVHEGVPNQDIVDDESVASNSFIQQYLKQQQEQLKQRHATVDNEAKADKGDIPEALANQVDELNQSLSRSQSEEAEKEPEEETTNGENTADKDAETAQEEQSLASRSSRRSRRQSSKQEEEAEVESETRKPRRRNSSRGRDQEEEQEEVKEPPQEEPMQPIIKEIEKKVQLEATQDEAQKVAEPSAPKEKVDEVEPTPTPDAKNEAAVQMEQGKKPEVEEAKDSGPRVEQASAPRDVKLPDPAASKQMEAGQDKPTEIKEATVRSKPEAREQAKTEAKPSGEVAEDTASQGQATNQVQVATEKEASHDETGKATETKEEQQSESKQFPSQKRVKLNRSANLSRSMGSKTAEEEKKPEETQESVLEVSEKGDVPANKNEDMKDEPSTEKSPRKRVTPPEDAGDQDQPDTTSKRRKTESDKGDTVKGSEESSLPVTSPREDGAAAPEEKPVSMTMGTDEGKDAASAETPETNETEDGEIREEGEVMEAEQSVESNKEKEMESAPGKVEQTSRSRSFTSVSSAPVKTKRHSFSSKDKTKNDGGEEDKSEGAVNAPQVKKRRWGSTKKTTADDTMKTNVNISTQLLKDIIPEIKVPSADLELDLEPEGDLEGEEAMDVGEVKETKKEEEDQEEEEKPMPMEDEETSQEPPKRKFIRHTITAPGDLKSAPKVALQDEESDIDYEEDDDEVVTRKVQQRDDDDGEKEEKENGDEESESSSDEEDNKEETGEDGEKEGEDGEKEERKKKKKKKEKSPKDEGQENKQPEVKAKKVIQIKRAVRTVIDEPIRHAGRDQSPSKRPTSNIVHVINLVRPFTLPQLKELLGRYGTLSADGFWINNIKSHCYATFESSDGAVACRDALHGTTWPSSNPKTLRVEFADLNELQRHMGVVVAKKEEVNKAEPAREPATKDPAVRGFSARRERILHQDREKDLEQERRTKERERERENSRKEREWDRGKERSRSPERRRGRVTRSQERRDRHEAIEVKKEVDEPPAKLLDDLFRKTKATPCIYWLPLTEEQALERDKSKAKLALKREENRKIAQEERFKGGRDQNRDDNRMRRDREPERPRPARERSWSRQRRSRSRSRGNRRR